jgi:hypothetical protein
LACHLAFSAAIAIADEGVFFSGLDRTFKNPGTNQRRLVVERFYRLSARLSVFALYCDFKNVRGSSTAFSQFFRNASSLQEEANRLFGGRVAYNLFEKARNEESLRFTTLSTGSPCASESDDFDRIVRMNPAELDRFLAEGEFGKR